MTAYSRRSFLKGSAIAASAGLVHSFPSSVWARPTGANDAVRVAIIGLHNKGIPHLKQLLEETDVRITALCDLDPAMLARARAVATEKQVEPFTCTDPRDVLNRADVDAVVVATGNHWHALLTVWACQAGKDVYVEKPMSHTVWEGRKMIESAARYGRIVQAGMQYSSDSGLIAAGEYVRSGQLGKIKHVRAVFYSKRDGIGKRFPWYPKDVDYNLFCGPAAMAPLERDQLHYDWHWSWATGNGELGNNGVHLLGVAFRMLGYTSIAPRVLSVGGRFGYDDVGETPNTMLTVYDYPDTPIIYEQRNLPAKPGVNYSDQCHGLRAGIVATCEGGVVAGLVGASAVDQDGKLIQKFPGDGGATHMRNFLDSVKSRRAQDLKASVEFGHVVAAACHHGNISYRIGQRAPQTDIRKSLASNPAAEQIFGELQTHLGVHQIDLDRHQLTLGQSLECDATGEAITQVSSGDARSLEQARYLLHESQRPPFVIPDQV
ncbi:MAG: Gfo/Idh/MocA family oxidoreductase [Opitutus sp.]